MKKSRILLVLMMVFLTIGLLVASLAAASADGIEKTYDVSTAAIVPDGATPAGSMALTDYATDFEPADGFAPGFCGGQSGWTAFAASTAEGHIDTVNPLNGTQHMRISNDPAVGTGTSTGCFSPDWGPQPPGPSVMTVSVSIGDVGGADYDVVPQAPSQAFLTARVKFEWTGNILILDDIGGGLTFIDSGTDWLINQYMELVIEVDPGANTIDYYLDDTLIYTSVAGVFAGTAMEQVVFLSDNFQVGESGDFDTFAVDNPEPAPAVPAIALTKTVDVFGNGCPGLDSIDVLPGTDVEYCYEVTNTGNVTLSLHTLDDSELGILFTDLPFDLGPGQSTGAGVGPVTINTTTINTGTWTASTFTGYTFDDMAPYNYISINTTGTPLDLSDDGEANITLPFDFTYYGVTSDTLRVGNNGGILFNNTTAGVGFSNAALPSGSVPLGILPFWDDIDSDTGNVYWEVQGTAPNRIAIVEWYDRPHFSNTGSATFEVILFEGSNEILFQYEDVDFGDAAFDFGASATVGLNEDGTTAEQYSYNQPVIANQTAILWMPTFISATADDTATVNVLQGGISLVKTVGTVPGVCATTSSINVPFNLGGTVVYYCYEVTNTGTFTLPLHDLVDSELGTIFTGFAYDLGPGDSVDTAAAGLTISATITGTTINTATWSAYLPDLPPYQATASASVGHQPTDVTLSGISGESVNIGFAWMAGLLVVIAGLGLALRRKMTV